MAKINRVERVALFGGIIGSLATNPRNAIETKCKELNAQVWNCHQISPHSTRNIFVMIIQTVVLVLTLFLWTFGAGYILLFEKEVKSDVTPTNTENAGDNWVCKKCNTQNVNAALFCKSCGEHKYI
jgi:ribosomal protein L40E